jgi:hypothetical protein
MATQILTQLNAWSPGAELWVAPDFAHSSWTPRLDWYLNFLVAKADHFKPQSLSKDLKEILDENDMKNRFQPFPPSTPLLTGSSQCFPNRHTVFLPFQKDLGVWLNQVVKLAGQLKVTSLRVFLPKGVHVNSAQTILDKQAGKIEVALVSDESAGETRS